MGPNGAHVTVFICIPCHVLLYDLRLSAFYELSIKHLCILLFTKFFANYARAVVCKTWVQLATKFYPPGLIACVCWECLREGSVGRHAVLYSLYLWCEVGDQTTCLLGITPSSPLPASLPYCYYSTDNNIIYTVWIPGDEHIFYHIHQHTCIMFTSSFTF